MRIRCINCGERGNEEFVYHGDATVERPNGDVNIALDETTMQRWHDYVYLRDNPDGGHRELWYHASGCRAWLVVTRNLGTHEILSVAAAADVALGRRDAAASGERLARASS